MDEGKGEAHEPIEESFLMASTRREFLGRCLTASLVGFAALVAPDVSVSRRGRRVGIALANSDDRFFFAQVRYRGGNWDPHPEAIQPILKELEDRTSVEAAPNRKVLSLTDPDLFSYPFLYMAGRRSFDPFSEQEVQILRRFLSYGGFLLADDAAGHEGFNFDLSFRNLMGRVFPDRPLERLPRGHTVFRSFYIVRHMGGRVLAKPYLEGITIDDWTPVIYSQNDLGGAWARDSLGNWLYRCEPGGELQRFRAFKIGINVIMYALTANYKRDQIHIPFLRKKIG